LLQKHHARLGPRTPHPLKTEIPARRCYFAIGSNGYVSNLPDFGPNFLCTVQPIIRLTNNQTAILNEINAMAAYGATVVPTGLTWGWHLLSPNGPFGDGVAYTDTQTVKAIILVTDGQNDVQLSYNGVTSTGPTNGFNKSVYNAYGYESGPHLNIQSLPASLVGVQDLAAYNLDQKEIQLCNNINGRVRKFRPHQDLRNRIRQRYQ
jgi:hypothetical protein